MGNNVPSLSQQYRGTFTDVSPLGWTAFARTRRVRDVMNVIAPRRACHCVILVDSSKPVEANGYHVVAINLNLASAWLGGPLLLAVVRRHIVYSLLCSKNFILSDDTLPSLCYWFTHIPFQDSCNHGRNGHCSNGILT